LITSLAPNGITPNHATLNGAAAPNGAATAAWFQWGATASYGNNTASFAINASNLSAVSFSSSLSGLAGATLYYYRLVATNSAGASFGPGLTFATLPIMAPTVTTLAASAVSPAGATLNGSVNPNGADTIAWFQYGTNSSYGSTTPAFVISASSSAAVPASASLTGLMVLLAAVVMFFAGPSRFVLARGDLMVEDGRSTGAEFILDAPLVSRLHCQLSATDKALQVKDLDSTNGTFVNGRRITFAKLQAGDRLMVGRVELRISRTD